MKKRKCFTANCDRKVVCRIKTTTKFGDADEEDYCLEDAERVMRMKEFKREIVRKYK